MKQSDSNIKSVLVIDDDPTMHLWANRHLTKAGFQVISAANGLEGLEAFNKYTPDIVLVDIEMPELDGFATCARLKALPNGKNTPLLMVTGTEDADRVETAYLSGATDYVVKPVNWQVLIKRLHYMIKSSQMVQQLEQSESRLSKAQQLAKLGYWEWHALDGKLYWSDEIYEIFRLRREDINLDHNTFLARVAAVDRSFVEESLGRVLKTGKAVCIEYGLASSGSEQRFVSQQIEIVTSPEGQITGLTGTIQDITERKEHESKVRRLAYYDPLTELPNRICFLDLLSRALELAKRNNRNFAVLFLDLDGFKDVNDTYGHHAGDTLLKEIARRLTNGLRRSDIASRYLNHLDYHAEVARLGGDEFTILLNELTHPEDAAIAAEGIQKWFAEPVLMDGKEIYSSVSVGIAVYPQDGSDSETLLKNADVAMYHAKKLGKGSYQYFHNSMNAKVKRRLEIANGMHSAVPNNELRL